MANTEGLLCFVGYSIKGYWQDEKYLCEIRGFEN